MPMTQEQIAEFTKRPLLAVLATLYPSGAPQAPTARLARRYLKPEEQADRSIQRFTHEKRVILRITPEKIL